MLKLSCCPNIYTVKCHKTIRDNKPQHSFAEYFHLYEFERDFVTKQQNNHTECRVVSLHCIITNIDKILSCNLMNE